MTLPKIGIIGLGHVGQTLFHALMQYDYEITCVYNRTVEVAITIAQGTEVIIADTVLDVVNHCDLILLCVKDDAIGLVAGMMIQADWMNKGLVHMSGAESLDVLQPLREKGAMIGSLHPALPFANVASATEKIIGATFAIEYSDIMLREWLTEIVTVFKGHTLEIPAGKKAQYHLALAIASNYMVTLYAVAEDLLSEFSQDPATTQNALNTLMSSTMENLINEKAASALTGPLVRGDLKTLRSHLDAISENLLLTNTYINLARLSYPMLNARGTDIAEIKGLFEGKLDASDNT